MSDPGRRGSANQGRPRRGAAATPATARPDAGHGLPQPTIWPAGLAAAVALVAAGLATHWLVVLGGVLLLLVALRGWVRDLLGDRVSDLEPESGELGAAGEGGEDG